MQTSLEFLELRHRKMIDRAVFGFRFHAEDYVQLTERDKRARGYIVVLMMREGGILS
ncbi:MAG: hypothetical protein HUJ51_05510 [Eggerthellaceae bacterium]|nr:hypothetical protein [Eggerthellaceae bacterium]